jgi:CO dehydrogenase/acetyl-CoA synthase gamma subunit (corrinoid Fe-S protein)
MSEFKYGDIVDCRNAETDEWQGPFIYVTRILIPNWGIKQLTMGHGETQHNFGGEPVSWNYVQKHKAAEKPESELTSIKQSNIQERLENLEACVATLMTEWIAKPKKP